MEPVVRGLRVDPLATRPLSQVHTPTPSLEHAYAVYHRMILEQFGPSPSGPALPLSASAPTARRTDQDHRQVKGAPPSGRTGGPQRSLVWLIVVVARRADRRARSSG